MSVTAAKGFVASGLCCGIRRRLPDLALLRSLEPAVGGAMFTQNRVQAAPVRICKRHLELAQPQAVVANSGVANAATGKRGDEDARATAEEVGRLLEVEPEQVLVLSTGVIGIPLPLDRVVSALPEAVARLSPAGGEDAAQAIMTTDTRSKQSAVSRDGFTVGGMAKGSGMIHPNLATMLVVITTDYPLEPGEPLELLRPAVERSFNRISVDGECSTNDTVVLLANGASGARRNEQAFSETLSEVCTDLSQQIVADGEGMTMLLEIRVRGAATQGEATAIASRIAISPLVKTAAFGRDPNWGRVIAAAGSAPWNGDYARLDPDSLTLALNGICVFKRGEPQGVVPPIEGKLLVELDVGLGDGEDSYLSTDFSYDYVRINGEYTS